MTRLHTLFLFALLPMSACGDKEDAASGTDDTGADTDDTDADDTAGSDDTGEPFEGTPEVLMPTTGLSADHLAIVVNTDDPLSADIADAYADARGIDDTRILSFSLGTESTLDQTTFEEVKAELDASLGDEVQALLLTFTTPYRVECMGTSAAFGLGFSEDYCNTTGGACGPTAPVTYFESDSVAPFTDHGIRPTMMLSADTLEEAEEIIARGLAADDTDPAGTGWMIRTTDSARSVRYSQFEATIKRFEDEDLLLEYVDNADGSGSNTLIEEEGILFYLTGLTSVSDIESNTFQPGALADHLTSYGGILSDSNSQMPITEWLAGGATASFGTAHEPCNYTQKFPDSRQLIPWYFRGSTAIEAYWKSVHWPGEGNFVGEPLARPFSQSSTWEDGVLTIETTHPGLNETWVVEVADSEDGPWEAVGSPLQTEWTFGRHTIVVEDVRSPWVRLARDG